MNTIEGARPATISTKPARPSTMRKEEIKVEVTESDAEFEDDEEVEEEVPEPEVEEEVPYMEIPKFPPAQPRPAVKPQMRAQQPVSMPQFQPQIPLEEEIPFETYNQPAVEEASKEEQLRLVQLEIERLQNNGTFRAELLYQILQVNTHLGRISASLQKLAGG